MRLRIINWLKEEIKMDREAGEILTIDGQHHPRVYIDLL
jgi:hypothetical protein